MYTANGKVNVEATILYSSGRRTSSSSSSSHR